MTHKTDTAFQVSASLIASFAGSPGYTFLQRAGCLLRPSCIWGSPGSPWYKNIPRAGSPWSKNVPRAANPWYKNVPRAGRFHLVVFILYSNPGCHFSRLELYFPNLCLDMTFGSNLTKILRKS